MQYRIIRSIDIHFAHQIRGHEGACVHIHGHTWKFEIIVGANSLDSQGFVIDFGEVSKKILLPCYHFLDHSLAIGEETYLETKDDLSSLGEKLLSERANYSENTEEKTLLQQIAGARNEWPGGMKLVVFPFNPTSERLAEWFFSFGSERLNNERVQIKGVRIYETLHPVESIAEYFYD